MNRKSTNEVKLKFLMKSSLASLRMAASLEHEGRKQLEITSRCRKIIHNRLLNNKNQT